MKTQNTDKATARPSIVKEMEVRKDLIVRALFALQTVNHAPALRKELSAVAVMDEDKDFAAEHAALVALAETSFKLNANQKAQNWDACKMLREQLEKDFANLAAVRKGAQ